MGQPEPGAVVIVRLVDGIFIIEEILGQGAIPRGRRGRGMSGYRGYRRRNLVSRPNGRGRRREGVAYEDPPFDSEGNLSYTDSKRSERLSQSGKSWMPEWELLKKLGRTDEFRNILDAISYIEGGYTSINVCGGKLTGVRDDVVREIYKKSLTEMTIIQVTDVLQKVKAFDCGGKSTSKAGYTLAVGAYQIVPGTLRGLVDKIPKIDTHDKFDVEGQDAFGLADLWGKQNRHIIFYLFVAVSF